MTAPAELRALLRTLGPVGQAAWLAAWQEAASAARCTTAAIRGVFECALANGLITITPPDTWPQWVAVDPPYRAVPGPNHRT